jgi:hypothetical protein
MNTENAPTLRRRLACRRFSYPLGSEQRPAVVRPTATPFEVDATEAVWQEYGRACSPRLIKLTPTPASGPAHQQWGDRRPKSQHIPR